MSTPLSNPNIFSVTSCMGGASTCAAFYSFGFDVNSLRISNQSTALVFVNFGSTCVAANVASTASASIGPAVAGSESAWTLSNLPKINTMSLTTTSTVGVTVSILALGG